MQKNRCTYLYWALPLLVSLLGSIFAYNKIWCLFIVPYDASFHFSLITVNALFGGFLYTNYSLLLGLADNEVLKKVQATDIIHKRNSHILQGILYSVISVVSGLYLVLNTNHPPKGLRAFIDILCINVEITFMGFAILYFALSLYEMHRLINIVNTPEYKKSESEIDSLREKIKRPRTK